MDILSLMRERAATEVCPRCRRNLRNCELAMLREDDPQFTLQVTCALCRVTFVIVVQVRDRREQEVAEVADPGPPPAPPLSGEELLDLHELLRDHQGTLTDLLKP
ncbi:MAG TPA: hypothetical protein VI316_11190 [Candidatus Dormibacteraeota bacterium]